MIGEDVLKKMLSYTISFCVGIFFITYILNLPEHITGADDIVTEYYKEKYLTNVPLDCFFVLCYFIVAELFNYIFGLKSEYMKVLMVVLVTAVLTGGFCYYFTTIPLNNDVFFSRWFNTVGYSSVVYDVILLGFIYVIYLYMESYTNNET